MLLFDADRYITPLPLKPSMFTLGGGVGVVNQPHLVILKTLTVKLDILTLFEMIFWNCRDTFENKVERAI